ncbi:MAG: DNRLRE domain-containing protein [Anaerolineae bacterium]|nr:DNRLRE domain-containing protein [Anaerolineae bacterium]
MPKSQRPRQGQNLRAWPPPPVRRVNAPFFGSDALVPHEHETGIFWFGRVTPAENYVDVRVGYNNTELLLLTNVIDRQVWFNTESGGNESAQLTNWDALVFYVDTGTTASATPTSQTYRITAQVNWPNDSANYYAVAKGSGAAANPWTDLGRSVPLSIRGGWRGLEPNGADEERGWLMRIAIPFTSLGLTQPPAQGTVWRLGVRMFDRDDQAGTPIAPKFWPEAQQADAPNTWGELHFGFPTPFHPAIAATQAITIRHGLNGSVPDAPVGGGTVCADPFIDDYFTGFGTANYADIEYFNVQNQADVADWPCFSKYYVTFPLTALPPSLTVISATLTAIQFGNSGQTIPPAPFSSLIQVFTVAEAWQPSTLNWNNAPLAVENVSIARSLVTYQTNPVPSIPVVWDVTQAVDAAYRAGQPFNIVLYNADTAQNNGKYFWTSDVDEFRPHERPTLRVLLGRGTANPTATPRASPTVGPSPTPMPPLPATRPSPSFCLFQS